TRNCLIRHARLVNYCPERSTSKSAKGDLIGAWEDEDSEHENIRAALAWARETGNIDVELQLAGSAGRFYWPNRGLLTEGRRWLEEALARADEAAEGHRALAM